ncbi:apolipoprotein N-acyltransferase [Cytophagales bacterium LB-30]|uniref:Apolipoprotein N-acyltransferase n=1 Tax=Shiella aurantiaca TaxID=3058365 RepID=A0ABT8F5M4_9BACT|nr:apolipoprotein N-acyltransferase [Shiella aurantiaca]MDN4165772.1 apolipoprotein N-acyltransferase [Shiella aurantiaca]
MEKNSRWYPWLLVSISCGFFWLAWPMNGLFPLLFLAFVPLFLLEDHYSLQEGAKARWKHFGFTYLSLFIWNISTTWWVWNASPAGAVAMLVMNSLLMAIPFVLYRISKRGGGLFWGLFGFTLYWLTFEYIHLNWEISWPWLTLGNGFAMYPWLVQWFDVTGVSGGSFWVLLINILLFAWIKHPEAGKKLAIWTSVLLLLPIAISLLKHSLHEEKGEKIEVAIMQPNIDPYTEKFIGTENFIPFEAQLERFIELSEKVITPNTKIMAWPETALDYQMDEASYQSYGIMKRILEFKSRYPDLNLLTGLVTYQKYPKKDTSRPALRFQEGFGYYEMYNTALFIDEKNDGHFYHKSKLVPGVETMPYPKVFNALSELLFSLGGTAGGYAKQDERTVFSTKDSIQLAPSICYESIYGDFMAEYVKNGADFIFIITNDGWWSNSPGYKQHLHYARLRAIETRRSIARSANTGISTFINQRGDLIQQTNFWEQDARVELLQANTDITYYVRHGDFIYRTASWLAGFVLLAALVKRKINR